MRDHMTTRIIIDHFKDPDINLNNPGPNCVEQGGQFSKHAPEILIYEPESKWHSGTAMQQKSGVTNSSSNVRNMKTIESF